MQALAVILVVCLIGKDLLFAPYPYGLRAVAQVLCLLAAAWSLVVSRPRDMLSRYWPVIGYVVVLVLTIPLSEYPIFVMLQVASLLSAILFFAAYFGRAEAVPTIGGTSRIPLAFIGAIIGMYVFATVASLVILKVSPSTAYESQFIGNAIGYEARFRGLFSKAGMMGAAAGLLVGIAATRIRSPVRKSLTVLPGLICLVLTQSRTFWIAAAVAGLVTAWRYYPQTRRIVVGITAIIGLALMLILSLGVKVDATKVERFARVGTLTTLTGRTALWADSLGGMEKHPLLGYGLTLGSSGLEEANNGVQSDQNVNDPTQLSRRTLHNGFIQCAMDSGAIGLAFYVMTMMLAIVRIVRNDTDRLYPEAMYTLLFLCVANLGESIIYSGAVFQSIAFWAFAMFALSLDTPRAHTLNPVAQFNESRRPSNLMA